MADAAPQLAVRVRVEAADYSPQVVARVDELARLSGAFLEEQPLESGALWLVHAGAIALSCASNEEVVHPRAVQLALAALFYWVLCDVPTLGVEMNDDAYGAWVSFETASALVNADTKQLPTVRVVDEETLIVESLKREDNGIVDARSRARYLGIEPHQPVSGHLDGSISVPLSAVFDEEVGAFLSDETLLERLEAMGVDFTATTVVIGSGAIEVAAVATALAMAGHTAVQMSLVLLTDALVERLPLERRTAVFSQDALLYPGAADEFDLSPSSSTSAERSATLDKEYTDQIRSRAADDAGSNDDDFSPTDEVVWHNSVGHRYFDMSRPLTKPSFIDASRDIYRVVSFVLAPFGFPGGLQDRFSISEIKTRSSSLFQDVIEVCSDLVYHHRGLNEGAMALSVHKWVEQKRDRDCSEQVRAINDLLNVLYEPPTFIEVPDVSEDRVLQMAQNLQSKLSDAVRKRAPWAYNELEEMGLKDAPSRSTPHGTTWGYSTYPSVVYSLGFLPGRSIGNHTRLSTLQIKSFIQAAAEAVWEVISQELCSQVEFQALCDTVRNAANRDVLQHIKDEAERTLYVLKHALNQSIEREDHLVDSLAAVQEATEDGNRAYRSSRYEVALSYYSHALSKLPVFHPEATPMLVGRVKCLVQLGNLTEARQQVMVLLKVDPFNVAAYTCLGEIDEKESRSEEAMQNFVTAFILDGSRSPDHASAIDRVARIVGRNVAKDIFKDMVVQHELPTKWLVDSYFDSFEHDVDHAARVPFDIEKSFGLPTEDLAADKLLYRAIQYKRKRQYKEAQADIKAVLTKEFDDVALRAMALNLHASFLYVAGDVHAAIEAISESLELAPTSVNGLVKKGGFLSEIGDMDEATNCFDMAAEIDPNDADVYLHMGQKDLLEGKYYEAVQCLRRAISRSEVLPVTHISYGMALYKSGSSYQAVDVFEDATKAFPNSPEVHLFYGEVLADQGDYGGAMRHFLLALELSPECPLPFLNAGRVYVSTNDPMRAIAHFEQALSIDPRCSSAHLDIAQVLFAQGRTAEAFLHFDSAAQCCRFLPEVEEVCSAKVMAKMQERVTDILGVDLRHIMRSK